MRYDGGYVPSGTTGIQMSYSISTSGLSCTSTAGSIAAINSVRTNGGSPDHWWLQDIIGYYCGNYPSAAYWEIGTQVFDNSGSLVNACPPTCGDLATLSTSTYSSLSGTISVYYSGSAWILNVYVSQTGLNYQDSTYSSIQGTGVDGSSNAQDSATVETDPYQSGLHYTSSFAWDVTNPEFYVAGGWQTWDSGSSGSCSLDAYVMWSPLNQTENTLAVQKLSNDGVSVYEYGSSPPNNQGTTFTWTIASSYYLTMTAAGTGTGTVSPSSGNQNCDSGVSISASPGSGYLFCNWVGTGSGSYTGTSNSATVTMNSAISETAYFRATCPMVPTG